MILNEVHQGILKRKNRKRVGRGVGSGHGETSGRGVKGHSSRSGHSFRMAHEGGQKPLARRVAKSGFNNKFHAAKVLIINVDALNAFEDGTVIELDTYKLAGLANGVFDEIKILGNGTLERKLTVKANRFSQSALDKIVAAGGTAEVVHA